MPAWSTSTWHLKTFIGWQSKVKCDSLIKTPETGAMTGQGMARQRDPSVSIVRLTKSVRVSGRNTTMPLVVMN